jgi:hypothetical protein
VEKIQKLTDWEAVDIAQFLPSTTKTTVATTTTTTITSAVVISE